MLHKITRVGLLCLLLVGVVGISLAQEAPNYLNPDLPVEERIDDLLARMTLEEKIGQMTLVEIGSLNTEDLIDRYIGGVLNGGGGAPSPNTVEAWADRTDSLVELSLQSRLAIPVIYGTDAVHGHANLRDAVVFPHNIGLGATNNPDLLYEIGEATACEMIATGIYWNYAPVLAVTQDIRWGRTYEGYGQDTDLVTTLATAYLNGMQGDDLSNPFTVAGTPKHFIADGGVVFGTSTSENYTGPYLLDQGDTIVDEETLRAIHLPPYQTAIENGAMVIMGSFSSWNGVKVHGHEYLLTDILKGELGFDGFIVSDWQAIDQIDDDFYTAVVTSINAGIDMNMVPYDYITFIDVMLEAVNNDDISIERIDDAVRRILRVKFMLGLFENAYANRDLFESVGSDTHRALAQQAVSQSMVLLQNNNDLLPLSPDVETVFLAGDIDDIGIQSGGWTISWQGSSGNITEGTTIRDAIEATVSEDTHVAYNNFGRFDRITDDDGNPLIADVAIVVLSEIPYAEGVGDVEAPVLSDNNLAILDRVQERAEQVIVILLSGRPLILTDIVDNVDALIAGWLPGTEGQGVADVLFGLQPFTGTTSHYFPRSMEQMPLSAMIADDEPPLFAIGDGITTGSIDDYDLIDVNCGE